MKSLAVNVRFRVENGLRSRGSGCLPSANTDLRYLRNGRLAVRPVIGRLAEGQMDVGRSRLTETEPA